MGNWLLHYVPVFNAIAAVGIMIIQAINLRATFRVKFVQRRIEKSVNGRMSQMIEKIPHAERERLASPPPIDRTDGEEEKG